MLLRVQGTSNAVVSLYAGWLAAMFFLTMTAAVLLCPIPEYDGDEGFELAKVRSVMRGYPLYETVWADHPPFHNLLLRGIFKLTGESVLGARILALTFSAGLIFSFFWICSRFHGQGVAAVAFAIFLALGNFLPFAPAVMIVIPAYSFALLSVVTLIVALQRQASSWMCLSAACLGFGLQSKFIAILLVPLCIVLLSPLGCHFYAKVKSQTQSSNLEQWCASLKLSAEWLLMLLAAVGIVISFEPGMLTTQIWKPHFGSEAREVFANYPNAMWNFISRDWALFWLSLYAFYGALIRGALLDVLLPTIWFGTVLIAYSYITPYWEYNYFQLVLPASWLAAIGIEYAVKEVINMRSLRFANIWCGRFLELALVIICVSNILSTGLTRLYKEITDITIGHNHPDWQIVAAMKQLGRMTNWVYSDRPTLTELAGLSLPPELAVVSTKRFVSGDLNNGKLLEILAKYNPEQVLLESAMTERNTAIREQLYATHVLYRTFSHMELWVKESLVSEMEP